MRLAPGVASSAAEISPPAAVSATQMVSPRDLSSEATESAMLESCGGGKALEVVDDDILRCGEMRDGVGFGVAVGV